MTPNGARECIEVCIPSARVHYTVRKRCLDSFDTFKAHGDAPQREAFQRPHAFKGWNARIGDVCAVKIEMLEPAETLEVEQSCVPDSGIPQVQILQLRHSLKMNETSVGHLCRI